jgi:hypothetical protein
MCVGEELFAVFLPSARPGADSALFKISSSSLVKSYPAKRSFTQALRRYCEVGFVSIGKSIDTNLFGDGSGRDGGEASLLAFGPRCTCTTTGMD